MNGDPAVGRVAAEVGLPQARLIGPSKSDYRGRHPDHAVFFNATLIGDEGRRLWWGDIDLTRDEAALAEMARRLGRRLHLLSEGDAWDELDPRAAVVTIEANGDVIRGTRWPLTRDGESRLVLEWAPAQPSATGVEADDAQG